MVAVVNFAANGSATITLPVATHQGGAFSNVSGRVHQLWLKGGRNAAGNLVVYYKWWC